MTDKPNTPQEIVEDLLTDPDADAGSKVPPAPPQTIANEPSEERPER